MARRLHKLLHDTVFHRLESREAFERWKHACEEFHTRYDTLAFPGGLSSALERLAAGDILTAETAIIYLEVHPYCFRSQYVGTMLIRRLKKLRLPDCLQEGFNAVIAAARERRQHRRGQI